MRTLTIQLASDVVVLRAGMAGEDGQNALLSGKVKLELSSQASLKDLTLLFSGRARTAFTENQTPFKSHHLDEDVFSQEFSLLPAASSTGGHAHTLPAGEHEFPFTLDLPPELPASTATHSGSIYYRIKVTAVRPGFTERNWVTRRPLFIHHGLRGDALEYQSSLDIENDWPGKLSYAITIPFKAHAAGSLIPVHVKFVPHRKGVRVNALVTTVREHTTLYSKNHSSSISRDILTVKHDLSSCPGNASFDAEPVEYVAPGQSIPQGASTGSSGITSPPNGVPMREEGGTGGVPPSELHRRLASVSVADRAEGPVPTDMDDHEDDDEDDDEMSTDVHTILKIAIPRDTPPSHSRTPIVITHRIKWSALIQNPDGHTSELRCALPLHILAANLGEEARLASSGASNLLFGPSGVLIPISDEVAHIQLPSYRDHVHDRVANAHANASYFPIGSDLAPTSWSNSARSSPAHTPLHTPSPSRPASPVQGGSGRGSRTPVAGASSSSLSALGQSPINWADEELRGTLRTIGSAGTSPTQANDLDHVSPPSVSRSTSRSNVQSDGETRPPERSHSSSSQRFHLHIPKPLRSFTSLSSYRGSGPSSIVASPSSSFPPSAHPNASSSLALHSAPAVAPTAQQPRRPPDDEEEEALTMATPRRRTRPLDPPASEAERSGLDVLEQVPSYEVAATTWLGGGVTPIDRTLPDY